MCHIVLVEIKKETAVSRAGIKQHTSAAIKECIMNLRLISVVLTFQHMLGLLTKTATRGHTF